MPYPLIPAPMGMPQDPQAPQTVQVDQRLRVVSERQNLRYQDRVLTFEGNVTAYYGVTVIQTEKLTLYLAENDSRGVAEGRTVLTDPEGTVQATALEFSWKTDARSAKAANVRIEIADVLLTAERADMTMRRWEFHGVALTPCIDEDGLTLRLKSLVIEPGRKALGNQVQLRVFNRGVINLPRYEVSLDRRVQGFRLPTIAYSQGDGIGVAWGMGYEFAPNTFLTASASSFPNTPNTASATISHSFLSPDDIDEPVLPRSARGEAFRYGYFDNITIRRPEDELKAYRSRRATVAAATAWNIGSFDDRGGRFQMPYDLSAEFGGPVGPFGVFSQVRLQRIGTRNLGYETRGVFQGSVSAPMWRWGAFTALSRVDGRAFTNDGGHGWARASLGLLYAPHEKFRLGAAYSELFTSGQPRFGFDEPNVPRSLHVRMDAILGPSTIGVLLKRDLDARTWYSQEFFYAHVMGCFEPYVIWRENPRRFAFGVTFRPLLVFERLRDRNVKRLPNNQMPAPMPGHP